MQRKQPPSLNAWTAEGHISSVRSPLGACPPPSGTDSSFRQSRVPKTAAPQATQAAWRPIFLGRKRGLGTRAPNAANANADRLPPPPPQHSTSASEPCGQRHRLSPRLPDRTTAFLPLLPRPTRSLGNCAVLKYGEDFSTSLPPSASSLHTERHGLHSVTF